MARPDSGPSRVESCVPTRERRTHTHTRTVHWRLEDTRRGRKERREATRRRAAKRDACAALRSVAKRIAALTKHLEFRSDSPRARGSRRVASRRIASHSIASLDLLLDSYAAAACNLRDSKQSAAVRASRIRTRHEGDGDADRSSSSNPNLNLNLNAIRAADTPRNATPRHAGRHSADQPTHTIEQIRPARVRVAQLAATRLTLNRQSHSHSCGPTLLPFQ